MTIQSVQTNYGNATMEYTRKTVSTEEFYHQLLEEKMSQQDEVIRNGSTEEAIPLGGAAFTSEEWEEMLSNFDATMDDLREQMREEHARRYEEQIEKMELLAKEMQELQIVGDAGINRNITVHTEFSTSQYDVVPNDEFDCYEIYNKSGESVGTFFYSDIKIRTDSATGTQLLISEHGTAAYDAMLLDHELISGFQQSMGVEALEEETLTGFALHRHMETGIRYLVKAGDEGRGGRLLISTEAEREAIDNLAETYMKDYPNLVSNQEVAQINAVLEVLGLMERTPNGIVSINRDGMSYNDNTDSEKNWALLFKGEYYDQAFDFVKLHRVLGTDLSDYKLWDEFFEENGINIERIWSDEELEQGYLNN